MWNYWNIVQHHQAGGIDQYAAMETAENQQFSMKALACMAPDCHGAFMDAPEWLARGIWR